MLDVVRLNAVREAALLRPIGRLLGPVRRGCAPDIDSRQSRHLTLLITKTYSRLCLRTADARPTQ